MATSPVYLMRRDLVRPSHIRHFKVRCTAPDAGVELFPVAALFLYKERLDADALARSLASALAAVPVFAARIARIEGALHLQCDGEGASFNVASSERSLADAIRSVTEDQAGWLVDLVEPRRARRGEDPLLTVRVTHLADGATVLGCCWHHSVGDMHSFMLLMKAWSAAAAGNQIVEPLIVEDRVEYLDQHLPPDGVTAPGFRQLGFVDIVRYAFNLAFESRKRRAVSILFGEQELRRMREAYGGREARISANDAICAHMAQAVCASDPEVERRRLSVIVNTRPRCHIDASLIGNMLGTAYVEVAKTDSASAVAQRVRRAVDRFAEEYSDARINQALAGALSPSAFARCLPNNIDLIGRSITFTNWSKFGVYDVCFDGARPFHFTPLLVFPVPWMGAIVEGIGGRGQLCALSLPPRVADAISSPEMLDRIHCFRDTSDEVPELHEQVHRRTG